MIYLDSLIHRKESLILSTIDLIDKFGIHQISIREIANHQGITEGAIYRHFKSKNELLLEVLEFFSKYDNDIFYTANEKESSIEAIIFVLESLTSYYENYPSITATLKSLDIMRYDSELKEKAEWIISNRFESFQKIIQKGQMKGQISSTVDSEAMTDIIMGTCLGICSRWRMQGYNFSLRDKTISAIQLILDHFNQKDTD